MSQQQHPQVHAQESGTSISAQQRWNLFEQRCELEASTKISFDEQEKLESILNGDLQLILNKIHEGVHIRTIHCYLQMFYNINIDHKSLARYWRRVLHGYTQAEAQQRELRTAERALKNLNQGE